MAERTERLMSLLPEAVGEQAVDGALITSPANRLYLTGMETSAGLRAGHPAGSLFYCGLPLL